MNKTLLFGVFVREGYCFGDNGEDNKVDKGHC